MNFSILHSSARPDKWKEIRQAWLDAADKPDQVQYVLVCDRRWGFDRLPHYEMSANVHRGVAKPYARMDVAVWNTGRRCYVDGVNIAAAYAEGDVLIVNADDQYPCGHWDSELLKVILDPTYTPEACLGSNFVVEVTTNTPAEHDRGIMVMPILSHARYREKGYVFYPAYESMYADNDFCEQARADNRNPRPDGTLYVGDDVQGIVLNARHLVFPHRHPIFDAALQWDAAYEAQNRKEAYQLGEAVVAARRQSNFGEVKVVERPPAANKQKLACLLPGENFSQAYVGAWTSILSESEQLFEVNVQFGHSSNVYFTRQLMADSVAPTKPDLILWLDDDQVLTLAGYRQLLADLAQHPELDAVAGWAWCQANIYGGPEAKLSCGVKPEGEKARRMSYAELMGGEADLKPVYFSGFPALLMRGALLDQVAGNRGIRGERAFLPIFDEDLFPPYGMSGEDAAFTMRAHDQGFKIAVDRRVKVPHLKLRCAEPVEGSSLEGGAARRPPEVAAPARTGA